MTAAATVTADALREQPVDPTDPASMGAAERTSEIASILARGYLRHVLLRSVAGSATEVSEVPETPQNELDREPESERTCAGGNDPARP